LNKHTFYSLYKLKKKSILEKQGAANKAGHVISIQYLLDLITKPSDHTTLSELLNMGFGDVMKKFIREGS
jgi:hypothetical protein